MSKTTEPIILPVRLVENRIIYLKQKIKEMNEEMNKLPDGNLRIAKKGQSLQFYKVTEKRDTKGEYLPKEKRDIAFGLAQKDYYKKLQGDIEQELRCLNRLKWIYLENRPEETYQKMNDYRRQLISPQFKPDDLFVEQWLSEKYYGKGFADTEPEFYTDKGERVRSKSEILIANELNRAGIPYKYEKPIYITGIGNVYIDFTLLIEETREIKYLEHFGMMDEERYMNDFFRKISSYINSGIIPGVNLFMTFESKNHPINTKELKKMINAIKNGC